MNFSEYDDINIPDNLNEYIDKGIKKGQKNKKSQKKKIIEKFTLAALISIFILTTMSNIPSFANELIRVPIIGQIVKVLEIRGNSSFGGVITDGNNIIFDSLENDCINIYFTKNGDYVDYTPSYDIEYRKYPYTIVFTFNGVRGFENTNIEDRLMKLPFINDVYSIMVLDDSSRKIAVEFDKDVYFDITELKKPGMIQLKLRENKEDVINKIGYYVVSEDFEYGEELAIAEENLFYYSGLEVQKKSNGKFIIQFGPFDMEEDAKSFLNNLQSNESLNVDFSTEYRNLGEGPKIK